VSGPALPDLRLRSELRPGDLGRIVALHGRLYAEEHGWNTTFEAYVAQGLAHAFLHWDPRRDRIWIAETDDGLMGCIGIVGREDGAAQLRWFLLHPAARGRGLGRRLLDAALAYCREVGYPSVTLWTVAGLPAAAHLYRSTGFVLAEEHASDGWGRPVVEQRLELRLS
jgi:GNAT superfamily N-acetyltransferase